MQLKIGSKKSIMDGLNQEYKQRMERRANNKGQDSFSSTALVSVLSSSIKSGIDSNLKNQLVQQMDSNSAEPELNGPRKSLFDPQRVFKSLGEVMNIQVSTDSTPENNACMILDSVRELKNDRDSLFHENVKIIQQKHELEVESRLKDNTIQIITKREAERELNWSGIVHTITECNEDFANQELASIAKQYEAEKKIEQLNLEVFKLREVEEVLKQENQEMRHSQQELQHLQSKVREISGEVKTLEVKNSNLKKLAKEREMKVEKLSAQLTSTRSKYATKLRAVETETGKTIDSLLVELKLVKDINEKLLNKSLSTMEEAKGFQTSTFDSLYEYLIKESPPNYLEKVYENRYLSLLHTLKQTRDSNEIHHTTTNSLLMMISSSFEKFPSLSFESVAYFKTLIKEFQKRKVLKSDDIDFIKKIMDSYYDMMQVATDESVLAVSPCK